MFAPVHSQTAFEETVDRLGTAIKLGLLAPGTRLPAERELCARLGIARSTLRQALVALGQSGHLHATRGRGGGTFVADPLPPALPPSPELLAGWRGVCDERTAVEVGIAVVAAGRATAAQADALDELVVGDRRRTACLPRLSPARHPPARRAGGDDRQSAGWSAMMTEIQGRMSGLISHIAHPPEVLDAANDGHRRLVAAIRRHDESAAAREMAEHTRGTEHILAGLLPRG